jgi:tetratricopeptide (TPR) repeat protein
VSKRWVPAVALIALAALGLGTAGTAAAQAESCAGKNAAISKHLKKPMTAAFDAVKAQNWQEVITQVQIAQADDKPKSDFDTYWVHKLLASGQYGLKNFAESAKELESISDSPCLSDADKAENLKLITQVYYQLDNYPKVIEYGNRALKAGATPELALYVGQAYYLSNDFKNAASSMKEVIARNEADGKEPGEQNLRILHGSCAQLEDRECVGSAAEKLVKFYKKPEYWKELINSLMNRDATDNQILNALRLGLFVDGLTNSDQYSELAELSFNAGLPGDAQSAIEAGLAKNVYKPARVAEVKKRLEEAKGLAATDKASLAKQDTASKASTSGNADVKLGAAYLSYGDTAKAIEALSRGIGKGQVRNEDEANLLLGIAQLKAGNKAEAAKAFSAVSKDPVLTRIAKLWMLNT